MIPLPRPHQFNSQRKARHLSRSQEIWAPFLLYHRHPWAKSLNLPLPQFPICKYSGNNTSFLPPIVCFVYLGCKFFGTNKQQHVLARSSLGSPSAILIEKLISNCSANPTWANSWKQFPLLLLIALIISPLQQALFYVHSYYCKKPYISMVQ